MTLPAGSPDSRRTSIGRLAEGSLVVDLDALLYPKAIAVAGYSERPTAWSQRILRALECSGFEGKVFALRPRTASFSVETLTSLNERPIDLLVTAVPADAVSQLVDEASVAGVRAAFVPSAGFADAGSEGEQLQRRLLEAAGDLTVLGPNSVGLISRRNGMALSASPFAFRQALPAADVAVVSQSGALGFVLCDELERLGVPPAYYLSTGNEVVLDAVSLARSLLMRKDVQVVGLYLENVPSIRSLRAVAAQARAVGKHLILLWAGVSAAGERATKSHTAAVAFPALLLDAVAHEDGIVSVRTEAEFASAAAFHLRNCAVSRLDAGGIGVVTMSGGAGALIADSLERLSVHVPAFTEDEQDQIRAVAPFIASAQNPVDLGGMFLRHLDAIEPLLKTMAELPAVDQLLLYLTCGDEDVEAYERLSRTVRDLPVPSWMIWGGSAPHRIAAAGSPGVVYPSVGDFVSGYASAVRRAEKELIPSASLTELRNARDVISRTPPGHLMTESTSYQVCQSLNLPYVSTVCLEISKMGGFSDLRSVIESTFDLDVPLVAKLDAPGIPHRAQLGLVRLAIDDIEHFPAEIEDLLATAKNVGIPEGTGTLIIQPHLEHVGTFSLGAIADPDHGDYLIIGEGGDRIEAQNALRVAVSLPLTRSGLDRASEAALNAASVSISAEPLNQLLLAVSALWESQLLSELDFNPVLVTGSGDLTLVDALMVRQAAKGDRQ